VILGYSLLLLLGSIVIRSDLWCVYICSFISSWTYWGRISRKWLEIETRFQWSTYRKRHIMHKRLTNKGRYTWRHTSRDHSIPHIMRNRYYEESNGHVINDVRWPVADRRHCTPVWRRLRSVDCFFKFLSVLFCLHLRLFKWQKPAYSVSERTASWLSFGLVRIIIVQVLLIVDYVDAEVVCACVGQINIGIHVIEESPINDFLSWDAYC